MSDKYLIQINTTPGDASKSSFAVDVLKLVSGTTVAQFLGILVSPVLTRLYSPEAFGTLTVFTSLTSIFGVIACLRYELAIMLPEDDEEAANLLGVSLFFTLLVASLIVLVVLWGQDLLIKLLNAPGLAPYLWLVPPTVFVSGISLAFNYWNSRTKHFGRLSLAVVTKSVVTNSIQLGLGFAEFAFGGTMIGARVSGDVLAAAVLGGQIRRDDGKLLWRSIRLKKMLIAIKRYRKFPLYSTWSSLLNSISWHLPTFMLSALFSSQVVGYYALGFRILQMPMNLIGNAISQVFYQRAAKAKAQGNLSQMVEGIFHRLVMIGLFPMLILSIIGRDFYVVIFGESWAEAGVYTQILAVWAFFWFISSPLGRLFTILEKQEWSLRLNVVILVTRLLSLEIGGSLGSARVALVLFAGTGVLVYGYYSLTIMTAAGVLRHRIWMILGRGVAYFLPFGFLIILLSKTGVQAWLLLLWVCFSFGGYALLLWRREPDLFQVSFLR